MRGSTFSFKTLKRSGKGTPPSIRRQSYSPSAVAMYSVLGVNSHCGERSSSSDSLGLGKKVSVSTRFFERCDVLC